MAFKFGSPKVALEFEGERDKVTVYMPLDEGTAGKLGKAGKALAECKKTVETLDELRALVQSAITLIIGKEEADAVFALNPQAEVLQYAELFSYISSTFLEAYKARVESVKARSEKPVAVLPIVQDYKLSRAQPDAMARMMAAMEAANEPAD